MTSINNWINVPLGNVAIYTNGRAFKPSEWESQGYPIIRIQNLTKSSNIINYTSKKYEEKYYVENGDVLMAWSATLDVFIWNEGPAWLNQHIFNVKEFKSVISKKFLFFSLKRAIDDFYLKTHGTGIVHVTKPIFEAHEIPLPPLNEQKRIVTKLDKIIPRIDSVKARLDRVPMIIKRFRQSILTAAVTGKLTEKWREEQPDLESAKAWLETELEEQSAYITSGSRGWAKYYSDSGALFVRAQNIKTDNLILDDVAYVSLPNKAEGTRTRILKNDILITITGANVTKTAIVRTDIDEAYVNQHVALVRLNNPTFAEFIYLWLVSPSAGRAQLEETAYGAGKPGLNLQNIKDVKLKLPPLEEQKEIVHQVDKLFALADKLEAHYQKAKTHVDKLSQSVLAKAFRGELVPQDPNDEPAEKLLERIMEEKKRLSQGSRRTRRSKK